MKKRSIIGKFLTLGVAALMFVTALTGCGGGEKTVATDGSTSMEKVIGALGEAFEGENSGVTFTYNPTGSGTGITAVSEGRCDIGLSSRALKDEETAKGLKGTVLAFDGIAVIVNNSNPVSDLSIETIAYSCGYAKTDSYTRAFQRQKGMSPSAYRRLCRENKYSLYLVNNK